MAAQLSFEECNPFRRPDWRLERVLQMVDRPPAPGETTAKPGRSGRTDDRYVKGLRNFILRYRAADASGRNRLGYECPGLFWAYQIYDRRQEDSTHTALLVEARLLANQTDEQIAEELGTQATVVEWYAKLFFDVRDRLRAHDWVVDQVLIPAYLQGRAEDEVTDANGNQVTIQRTVSRPFFDGMTKWYAYFGGPLLLDHVLTGFRRGAAVYNRDEVGTWYDNHYINRIRARASQAAQTFEVTKWDVHKLFETNNQLIAIERSAQNQHQAKDQLHKAIGAMLTGMRWAVGTDGRDMVEGTALQAYDDSASELRDDEMQLVAAGQKPGTIEGIESFKLPPPRVRAGQEDQQHANAQQGS